MKLLELLDESYFGQPDLNTPTGMTCPQMGHMACQIMIPQNGKALYEDKDGSESCVDLDKARPDAPTPDEDSCLDSNTQMALGSQF